MSTTTTITGDQFNMNVHGDIHLMEMDVTGSERMYDFRLDVDLLYALRDEAGFKEFFLSNLDKMIEHHQAQLGA